MSKFHLHLVSDSTGETLDAVAKAALAQFQGADPVKHSWTMTRNMRQLDFVLDDIRQKPGIVMFTLVNEEMRTALVSYCDSAKIPYLAVIDPAIAFFGRYLGEKAQAKPGQQHVLNTEYFHRIDALNYTLAHDDGQVSENLSKADVILVGVSRTSKTPTCIYLANRGIKAANIPVVKGCPLPEQLFTVKEPLIVGLVTSPDRLVQIREARLKAMNEDRSSSYADPDRVRDELVYARRLFTDHGWPVIDVSRRSIEETAAAIFNLLNQRREGSEAGKVL
ncbi:pyruvate, water dikinase regulatory protein [Govanella unica]|uniref:Putative pyruvate, phosphate dikinase regulatory protein n=1 Tax=Govanella unica TaxID=2975056 RepID=A0A9X3Z5V7_9PROT|nr:pyruvate, water dikinase regulatory protein [Govania unica]MDA5192378.1 kinase/pyrophosphorylase [Govania unica]